MDSVSMVRQALDQPARHGCDLIHHGAPVTLYGGAPDFRSTTA